VKILDELFQGTLVDLPTFVETHRIGENGVVYKSADISQMCEKHF
jgi:TATA-binding protein-associated factor Taf7